MWAFFNASGRQPSSYYFWNIMLSGNFMDRDNSLNTLEWKPSRPADLAMVFLCNLWDVIYNFLGRHICKILV
jgi:hypothetical protein